MYRGTGGGPSSFAHNVIECSIAMLAIIGDNYPIIAQNGDFTLSPFSAVRFWILHLA
jgi:hypothetical protein